MELKYVFPRISHNEDDIHAEFTLNDEDKFRGGRILFNISNKTRILAWLLNIDYTAPIWVNLIAIIISIFNFY